MNAYICEACMNTFIITEFENQRNQLLKKIQTEKIDGLIIYKNNPLEMKVYNRDGSVASMCGNGIRCFLLYGYEKGYLGKGVYDVKTKSGFIKTEIINSNPFLCKVFLKPDETAPIRKEIFFIDGIIHFLYTVNIGTLSHIIIYKNDFDKEKIIERIKCIKKNNLGNISFVKLNSNKEIEVLTYERGVGYTNSCGTGNCAAFYVFFTMGLLNEKIKVINKGGVMDIYYDNGFVVICSGAKICEKVC